MDKESEVIHEQMRQTRAALADKLETLEDQVIGTAKEAVCSVQKTVETVTRTVNDTVTGAKETVQCTVSAAKDTMHETVDALKHAFDLKEHVVEHPWTMMAASTAAGFLAGRLLAGTELQSIGSRLSAAKPDGATRQGSFHEPMSTQPGPDKEGGLRSKFASEIDKVKSMGIAMAVGVLRDLAVQWAPEHLASNVKNVLDSVTVKLGGEPIQGPVLSGIVPGMHDRHEEAAEYGPTPAGRQSSSPRW